MASIGNQYWSIFQAVFYFSSLAITLNLILAIRLTGKKLALTSLISWLSSLALLVGIYYLTFFSGILYDELMLKTDYLLLSLSFYSGLVFIMQTIVLVVKNLKLLRPKKLINKGENDGLAND